MMEVEKMRETENVPRNSFLSSTLIRNGKIVKSIIASAASWSKAKNPYAGLFAKALLVFQALPCLFENP